MCAQRAIPTAENVSMGPPCEALAAAVPRKRLQKMSGERALRRAVRHKARFFTYRSVVSRRSGGRARGPPLPLARLTSPVFSARSECADAGGGVGRDLAELRGAHDVALARSAYFLGWFANRRRERENAEFAAGTVAVARAARNGGGRGRSADASGRAGGGVAGQGG